VSIGSTVAANSMLFQAKIKIAGVYVIATTIIFVLQEQGFF